MWKHAAEALDKKRVILTVAALLVAFVAGNASKAKSAEIIPSIGLTKSVDADQTRGSIGLALRAPMVKGILDTEVGVTYRSEQVNGGALTVRSWPLTASAWLELTQALYAGGGIGWYNRSYRYTDPAPGSDFTSQKVGVHLGGGVLLPLSPAVGLDMAGRYVFMAKESNSLLPKNLNADSWTTTVGLAVKF